jgi:Protein of unknown function (DUF2997)
MPKIIVFTIEDSGSVAIETSGFKGKACEAATKAFEEALGGSVTGKSKKPEYFQRETVADKARAVQ